MTDHASVWQRRTQLLLAAATVLLAALLIWQCASIYLEGTAAENMPQPGVYLRPVYSRETVARHLGQIWWGIALWVAALVAAIACRKGESKQTARGEKTVRRAPERKPEPQRTRKHENAWRVALYAAAVGLIAAGVVNGGARDVLVKAAQICTECIGLG